MGNIEYKNCNLNTLVSLSNEGDIKALEELIRRIQKNIYTMFSYLLNKRQEVADLTQETLLKVAKNIKTLKNTKNFKSWLHHTVINTYYDYLRKHSYDNRIEHNEDKLTEIKDKIGCEPGEKCLFSEMDKVIKSALINLPYELRIVIVLREFEGFSYEDISRLTNTTLGTVKSRIARARGKLKEQLKEFI